MRVLKARFSTPSFLGSYSGDFGARYFRGGVAVAKEDTVNAR